jgi:hypothetical protein
MASIEKMFCLENVYTHFENKRKPAAYLTHQLALPLLKNSENLLIFHSQWLI